MSINTINGKFLLSEFELILAAEALYQNLGTKDGMYKYVSFKLTLRID